MFKYFIYIFEYNYMNYGHLLNSIFPALMLLQCLKNVISNF